MNNAFTREWKRVHEDEIHPRDVDGDVDGVLPHGRRDDGGRGRVGPSDLEESRDVVEDREDENAQNRRFGPAVRNEASRPRNKDERHPIYLTIWNLIWVKYCPSIK